MSKIEEALNKARKSLPGSGQLVKIRSLNADAKSELSVSRGVVASGVDANSLLQRESSAKEIALMDTGPLLETRKLSEYKVIYSDMDDTSIANTYRDIRTKLIHISQGRNFVAMLTSCVPGYDTSNVSLNLSTAFTFDESKTSLLVDCDLSHPTLHEQIDLDFDKGLTDYLENQDVHIEDILHKPGIKRLSIIPSGASRETAAEYFTSIRMRDLMSNLLSRYSDRYIFLNTAPITVSADSKILIDLCDYVILVVPYGRATKKIIQSAAEAIGQEKLLGVIFNDVAKLPNIKIF